MLKIINFFSQPNSVNKFPENSRLPGILLVTFTALFISACGNKGPLYIPADQETLEQLEQAEKELEENAKKKRKESAEVTSEPGEGNADPDGSPQTEGQ